MTKLAEHYDYLIVGAGLAGAVLAERIASQLNEKVLVIDKRNHIGGNCYDYCDRNGILIQKYGPHIFHTEAKVIFDYLSQFTDWNDYKHKVVAFYKGKYYPIPVNLDTVNKFHNLNITNPEQLKKFLGRIRVDLKEIKNSKDVVVSKFGEELYEAFIKYYTKKQWGKFPQHLDKSVLKRLPIKYDKDSYYFKDKFQGMPKLGFTKMFENLLSNKNITVRLNSDFFRAKNKMKYDLRPYGLGRKKKLIFTGKIDEFFNYKFGKLKYRCTNFALTSLNQQSFQPNSVVNYPDKDVPFSRITEFKKFYNKKSNHTVICKEFFANYGTPAYPVIDRDNLELVEKYKKEAKNNRDIIFVGRLAQYKYLNMDQVVRGALRVFKKIKDKQI